jgi:hypothetical protein
MVYLSDANLRCPDGTRHAAGPESGMAERFVIEEMSGGVRVSVRDSYRAEHE